MTGARDFRLPPTLSRLFPLTPRLALTPKAARALYVALAATYAGLLLMAQRVYLLDLPYWVYEGAALRAKWLGTATGAAEAFPLKGYPVPNSLSQVALALAVGPLGAAGAGKLVAVTLLLLVLGSTYALCVRLHGSAGVYRALVLAATLGVSASYWNGYLNFQLGLAGLALYGALRARRGWAARPSAALTGAFGVGLFFCHFVAFFAFALGAGLEAVLRRDGRGVAALVPSGVLTAWYVLARGAGDAAVTEGYPTAVTFALYKGYTALKLGPFAHFLRFDGTGTLDGQPVVYGALIGGAALFVAALGVAVLRGAWLLRRPADPEGRARRAVVVLALALVALALPIPPVWLSVVNLGERLLAVALLLLVAAVPIPRRALATLALATLPFFAHDLAFLATLPAPDPAVVEEDLARRVAAGPERVEEPFEGHVERLAEGAARFPWLGRNPFGEAAYYLALERGVWALPLPSTGLVEGTSP